MEAQVVSEVDASYVKKQHQGKYHANKKHTSKGAQYIECMLADKYDAKKHNKFPYISQPKLDGIRCIVKKDGMWSRNGKRIVSAPHIFYAMESLFKDNPDLIFDGELYADKFANDFNAICSLVKKTKPTAEDLNASAKQIQYHIYDLPSHPGTFVQRYESLVVTAKS